MYYWLGGSNWGPTCVLLGEAVILTGDPTWCTACNSFHLQPDTFQQYRRQREMNHVLQPIICEKTKLDGGVAEVRCGSAHSLLLTGTGQVYVWGSNSRGQLGMPQISGVVSVTYV